MNITVSSKPPASPKVGDICYSPESGFIQFTGTTWCPITRSIKWALFLDDTREPVSVGFSTRGLVRVARSSAEAKTLIEAWGLPAEISFDHDLGGDDTGFSLLWWLINGHQDEKWDLRGVSHVQVHSANPIGAGKIASLWESFAKHSGIETKIRRVRAYEG